MSGETEDQPSAWTVDSLLAYFQKTVEHMDRRADERVGLQEKALAERFEAQQKAIELHASRTDASFHAVKNLIDERDRRYGERFDASQTAISAALISQEKAVHAALLAADRAVAKAETASEKRFESVNEFRQTLTDQASLFATRSEVDVKVTAAMSKIADNADQAQKDIGALASRMDRSEASKLGGQEQRQGFGSNIAVMGTLMAILFGVVTLVFTIISRT